MKIQKEIIKLETSKQLEFVDITESVQDLIQRSGVKEGMVTVFSPHTSASIIINHNEPMLLADFTRMLYKLVPVDERYGHDTFELTRDKKSDGRSNAHSHCKNFLLGVSESIPVAAGEMLLSSTQSIFFVELDGPRKRDYIISIIGE